MDGSPLHVVKISIVFGEDAIMKCPSKYEQLRLNLKKGSKWQRVNWEAATQTHDLDGSSQLF